MVKPRLRRSRPSHLSPSPEQPRPLSAFEGFNEYYYTSSSRPASFIDNSQSSCPRYAMASRPPSLTEILLDVAPPPWTLTAFMAYLSHNHCMETLEFTLDSQRYAAFYNQHISDATQSAETKERVCAWWQKLMQVYIIPCAPREVNIPARVRDYLLSIPYGPSPPHPAELDEAGRIVFELMNDSLLLPFLQSVGPLHSDNHSDGSLRSPKFSSRRSTASHGADSEGFTDDSDGNSPPTMEPMTPPTTPPTSEWGFNTSPGGFQRAVAAHNKGWKKVGAKLGFNRKSSSRRTTPTSSGNESGQSSHTGTRSL
ncbi:hypothetical protein PT974_10200 [Cladobotryum mycophilum]|uniref:RGS domain-containing protein n=1 Tax=Cladobotryum mycophilum TaxID=491253 RepID=A0ABR0SA43_9HYPO